jgi:hypothetical protein
MFDRYDPRHDTGRERDGLIHDHEEQWPSLGRAAGAVSQPDGHATMVIAGTTVST